MIMNNTMKFQKNLIIPKPYIELKILNEKNSNDIPEMIFMNLIDIWKIKNNNVENLLDNMKIYKDYEGMIDTIVVYNNKETNEFIKDLTNIYLVEDDEFDIHFVIQ